MEFVNNMPVLKDNVIVIKSINYSEADKILTVVGENFGKFSIIAKGIRKIESKNRGNIQTLCASEISFYKGKGLGVLLESRNIFAPDHENVNIKGVERILTLFNKFLQEGDTSYDFYSKLFFVLRNGFRDSDVNKFRLVFLKNMGFLAYDYCSQCGCDKNIHFINLETFEIFCQKCYFDMNATSDSSVVAFKELDYVSKKLTNYIDVYVQKSLF